MNPPARRYKLVLSYDGARYHGWQKQPEKPTVQGRIEAAFQRLFGEEVGVTGSGRTDAGVHALGQVAHVDLAIPLAPSDLLAAVNSQLPGDIRVRRVTEAPPTFHARYGARRRAYLYLIKRTRDPSPFLIHYTHQVRFSLDVRAMETAAALLIGTHDFSAFRASGGGHTRPIRTVFRSEIFALSEDLLGYFIVADAFLRKMVRGIVGTLLEIGAGHADPTLMKRILEVKNRSLMGAVAPPQGLYLVAVSYTSDPSEGGGNLHEG